MEENGKSWDGDERRTNGNVGRTTLERHLQTILSSIITIGIVWVASSMLDISKEQIRTTEQLAQMKGLYGALQQQISQIASERYTSNEARKDLAAIEARLQRLEDKLEERRKPKL
jgi:septal ring factor EnvC (AmiA/AmiB activator)